jgi:hypothetical protein
MFTGSAVRVQAVQDLKLQEGQEISRRSWKSGCQHPQSLAEARRREGREQEVEAGGSGRKRAGEGQRKEDSRRKIPQIPKTSLHFFPLAVSLLCPFFFPTLFTHFSFGCPFISTSHSFTLTFFSAT